MVEHAPWFDRAAAIILVLGVILVTAPVAYALFVAALPGERAGFVVTYPTPAMLAHNVALAWAKGDLGTQLVNSFVMAAGIAAGKIAISILSAFAVVYFRFRFRMAIFWLIFLTLMLPIEVRIVPTYEVAANVFLPFERLFGLFGVETGIRWSLLDSHVGLILPLVASATATFMFRQFFMTIPNELVDAARMDGATPLRFLVRIVLPLSRTTITALAVVLFIYGWNQYLWPLLITTRPDMSTVVMGVTRTLPSDDGQSQWPVTMAMTLLATLPPVAVVVLLQRWFIKGLVETEK